jgi:hypothetical protein
MSHYLAVFMGGLRLLFSGNREAAADARGQSWTICNTYSI